MQLDQLQPKTKNKNSKRVGRGGKRGTYSGRGIKGQGAHAGRSPRPELRDIIKKIPKRRGYGKNRARTVHNARILAQGVNLSQLEVCFTAGETVSPATLLEKRLVRARGGKMPKVKILGTGDLTKKLTLVGVELSEVARKKITGAGGMIT
ncbi:MAG: uL15 family ribosomal protein [bacterium]|nr:uL15 family ribosomal protein [bacterium]